METGSNDNVMSQVKSAKSDELIHLLTPVQRRLILFRLLHNGFWGLMAGCLTAIIWLLLGRFIPLNYLYEVSMILVFVGLLSGIIWGVARKLPLTKSAEVVDSFDRSNAIVTALNYMKEESPVVALQREQAIEVGKTFNKRICEHMPIPSKRKQLISIGVSIIVLIVLVVLPNSMDEVLAKEKQEREFVQEQQAKLDTLKQQIEEKKLPAIAEQTVKQPIERLEERLSNSKNVDQALEEMERAMKEMQSLAGDLKKEQIKSEQLLHDMAKQNMLAEVAKSMRQGDPNELKNAMDKLKQDVNKLSPEAKEALAKQLEQLADAVPQDGKAESDALRKALEAAAAAAKEPGGDANELQEKLAELNEQLANALAKMDASKQSLAAMQAQLAQLGEQGQQLAQQATAAGLAVANAWSAGQSSADALAAAGGAGAADDAAWDEAAAKAQGSGAGSRQGAGSGSGAGSGQGAGSGSGAGSGQGAGSGSGAGSGQGAGSGSGAGSGQGAGKGSGAGLGEGSRNLIMTPRKYEGEGNIYKDNGPNNDKGGETQKGGTSPMIDGVSRPYEEVYNQYATEAKDALNRAPLPERMQGLVEQYFLEIQPNP